MGMLRFLLALMVIFTHTGVGGDGRLAVQTFYMISGFYMAMVWTEKYSGQSNPVRTFYISRALRVYPLYFTVLACSVLMAWYLWKTASPFPLLNPMNAPLSWGAGLWIYLTQITLIGMETSIFYGMQGYWISPVAWSLGLELTFYLLVPFLLPHFRVAVVVFVASLAARYVAYHQLGWNVNPDYGSAWSYRFFPFEIALFLGGVFAYRTMRKMPQALIALVQKKGFFWCAVLMMVGALGAFKLTHKYFAEAGYWGFYIVAFFGIIALFQNTKNSKIDAYIGDFSFPMYILHLPVLWFVLYVTATPDTVHVIYFVLPITIILSVALNKLQIIIDRYRHSLVKIS